MRPLPDNLEIFQTQDGSPTLVWRRADGYVEKMHHSGGALEESIYIYHSALCTVLNQGAVPRGLSIGLGLGYNELLCLAEFLRRGLRGWRLWSFEAHPELRGEFERWLRSGDIVSELTKVHENLLQKISLKLGVNTADLHAFARAALERGDLQLRGGFPEDCGQIDQVNLILYDAYSKKMDPHLWDENTLIRAFQPLLAESCILTTYAATGSLNRTLKALGFRLLDKPGFLGKRECTLAVRGNIG